MDLIRRLRAEKREFEAESEAAGADAFDRELGHMPYFGLRTLLEAKVDLNDLNQDETRLWNLICEATGAEIRDWQDALADQDVVSFALGFFRRCYETWETELSAQMEMESEETETPSEDENAPQLKEQQNEQ